jgi:hypothetical protein
MLIKGLVLQGYMPQEELTIAENGSKEILGGP